METNRNQRLEAVARVVYRLRDPNAAIREPEGFTDLDRAEADRFLSLFDAASDGFFLTNAELAQSDRDKFSQAILELTRYATAREMQIFENRPKLADVMNLANEFGMVKFDIMRRASGEQFLKFLFADGTQYEVSFEIFTKADRLSAFVIWMSKIGSVSIEKTRDVANTIGGFLAVEAVDGEPVKFKFDDHSIYERPDTDSA